MDENIEGEEEVGEENKESERQEVDGNKQIEGQEGAVDENKGGQLPEIEVPVKKKSKKHTLNIFGFTLPFQV